MSEELKPCPHCGSKDLMLLTAGHPVHTLFGHCVVCGATGGKSTSRTGSGIIGPDAAAESIAAWNRRVVTQEQVEAAAEALRGHVLGCDSGVTIADHPRALYLRRAARCANIATVVFRAAGFEVEGLRHILPATISKLKTEE